MKIIKDPIYGYIELDSFFIDIVNSAPFQRLRNIIQTSYSSILPSSIHNRFSHSLGVYHLGKISFDTLLDHYEGDKEKMSSLREPFLFACLCHDIGHTPFSHTGEAFFNKYGLTNSLKEIVSNDEYNSDLKKRDGGTAGKQHEIMSALLSLRTFSSILKQNDYEFIARSIIGLKYEKTANDFNKFKNSCIELLNSKIIDVDKLDYLIRDSYMSGFSSVSVDYIRLIKGIRYSEDKNISIKFSKHSLNVLENVLSAHDLEVRWLQSHPSNCYESYLVQSMIRFVSKEIKNLFSPESLSETGITENERTIRLLSDSDIIYLAKQNYEKSPIVKEYFNRSIRKRPLWKTEAEFKALFSGFDFNNSVFYDVLKSINDDMFGGRVDSFSINDDYLQYLLNSKSTLENAEHKEEAEENIEMLNKKITFIKGMKEYLEDNNQEFDFMLLKKSQFVRSVITPDFGELEITFETMSISKKMREISDIQQVNDGADEYFYFFYKKKDGNSLKGKPFADAFTKLITTQFVEA